MELSCSAQNLSSVHYRFEINNQYEYHIHSLKIPIFYLSISKQCNNDQHLIKVLWLTC